MIPKMKVLVFPSRLLKINTNVEAEEVSVAINSFSEKIINCFPYDNSDSRPPIYSSDDDASDIDTRKGKKLEKAKTIIESENESDEDDSDGKKKRFFKSLLFLKFSKL
jgi:hypothetical protein